MIAPPVAGSIPVELCRSFLSHDDHVVKMALVLCGRWVAAHLDQEASRGEQDAVSDAQ
jgi:hypothetical protein